MDEHRTRDASIARYEDMLKKGTVFFFDVEEFQRIADHYFEKGDRKATFNALRSGIDQHPESTELELQYAQFCLGFGETEEAASILQGLVRKEPFHPEIHYALTEAYIQQGLYEKAFSHYEEAYGITGEESGRLLLDIAIELQKQDRYDLAIQTLERAKKADISLELIVHELNHCYLMTGAAEQAIEVLQELLEEEPYAHTAWLDLGIAYEHLDLYEKAVEAYEFAIVIEEDFPPAHFYMGQALAGLQRYQEAIDAYREFMTYEGETVDALCRIGHCFELQGKWENARIYYQKAIDSDPDHAEAWIGMGIALSAKGETKESLARLQKATELAPEDPRTWTFYAKGLKRARNPIEADLALERSLKLDPGDADTWAERASIQWGEGEPDQAIDTLYNGIPYCEGEALLRYHLTAYLLILGYQEEALENLEIALSRSFEERDHLFLINPEASHIPAVLDLIESFKS